MNNRQKKRLKKKSHRLTRTPCIYTIVYHQEMDKALDPGSYAGIIKSCVRVGNTLQVTLAGGWRHK